MLIKPAINLILIFQVENRLDERANGKPIKVLIISIPPMEPIPKTRINARPSKTEFKLGNIKSIIVALPANPWNIPTKNDLCL